MLHAGVMEPAVRFLFWIWAVGTHLGHGQGFELYGLMPDKDIKSVFSGIGAGEKLFEELLSSEENCMQTKHPQILKAKLMELEPEKLMAALETLQGGEKSL